jgi:hypothetical protein
MKLSLTAFLLTLCGSWGAYAQSVAGSSAVTGFVLEDASSGLPEATVTVVNVSLGLRRQAGTTDDGVFYISALPPAAGYHLKIVRKGFVDWESSEFELAVGQSRTFRIEMQREGAPATIVKVPALSPDQSDESTWIDPVRANSLPSSGRLLDPLVLTAPAVTLESTTGRIAFQAVTGANAFLQDGVVTTSGYFGERRGIAGPTTRDTTQEFRVHAATYPAEFGRAMGGVVDAVTSSGGNQFHGAGFEYLRNSGYNAESKFAPGVSLLGKRIQSGANFGGPIRHDRLFFFANLESLTGHFQGVNQITSPALATSNCAATVAQCAAAVRFIQSQTNVVAPFSEHWTGGLARIDYRPSESNSFNFTFSAKNARSPEEVRQQLVAPNGGLLGIGDSTERMRYAKAGWTATLSPGSVNELRLGLVEDRYFEPASRSTVSNSGVALTVAGATLGSVHPTPASLNEKRYQLVENLTMTAGTHTVRLGADLSKTRDYLNRLDYSGAYTYPTLTAFAQDFSGGSSRSYTSFTQQFGDAVRRIPYREVALYGQDTWRAGPSFAVTFGVRWEKTSLPKVPVTNPNYYQTGSIPSSNNAVSPRFGLTYAIGERTTFRAGFGFFYAPYTGQSIDALLNGNGLSQTSITVNPNQNAAVVFPRTLTFGTSGLGVSNLMYAANKLRNPHSQQATLALERRVARATTITASLISGHAVKLWTGTDVNLTTPVKAATYTIYNPNGSISSTYNMIMWTARENSNYAHIYSVDNGGWSWYNAGVIELRERLGHGLDLQASYTWSHATGTNTGPMVNGVFPLTSIPRDFTADKGNLPTDQRHRAVINWTWESNLLRNDSWIARFLINGWQISGIASLASGLHETPTVLVSGNQFSSFTMDYFNSLNGSGGWARVPFQAVGSLSTDPQRNLDARLARNFPFTERVKGVLAFEVFNVFNRQTITGVNGVAYTAMPLLTGTNVNGPYAGTLRPVAGGAAGNASNSFPDGTSARRAQLALKVIF